jgi:hypothetical protein
MKKQMIVFYVFLFSLILSACTPQAAILRQQLCRPR